MRSPGCISASFLIRPPRLSCPAAFKKAVAKVAQRDGKGELIIKYCDDDGDEVLITNSSSLVDAVNLAQARGSSVLKLTAVVKSDLMISAGAMWRQLADDLDITPAELNIVAIGAAAVLALMGFLSLGRRGGRR